MKILFLSHKIPYPPNKGDRIPTYYRLMHLIKRHQVSLAFPCFDKQELNQVEKIYPHCRSIDTVLIRPFWAKLRSLVYLFSRKPLTLPFFYSKALEKKIQQRIEEEDFDLIYVYSSSMAQYVIDTFGIKKVIDLADSDSHKWLQYAKFCRKPISFIYQREGVLLKEYEKLLADCFDHTIAISENEKKLFRTYIPEAKISVVPNGVDSQYFRPKAENTKTKNKTKTYEQNRIVFTGAMDYFANVDSAVYFCREILPLIKAKIPEVEFYIVGSNPSAEVLKLAEDKKIVVTGYVEDVRPYLRKANLCVVPLRIAQGMQNKILQAMASGVPVVTTTKGNQGIQAESGKNIIVDDDPVGFSKSVIKLMLDSKLRQKIAVSGREFVINNYNWERNLEKFENILIETHESN